MSSDSSPSGRSLSFLSSPPTTLASSFADNFLVDVEDDDDDGVVDGFEEEPDDDVDPSSFALRHLVVFSFRFDVPPRKPSKLWPRAGAAETGPRCPRLPLLLLVAKKDASLPGG